MDNWEIAETLGTEEVASLVAGGGVTVDVQGEAGR